MEDTGRRRRFLHLFVIPLIVLQLLQWGAFDSIVRLILMVALFAYLGYRGGADEGLHADPTLGLHETREPTDDDPRRYTPL